MDQNHDQMVLLGVDPLQGKRFFVRKRTGRVDEFNEARIHLAIESAFKAEAAIGRDEPLPAAAQLAVKRCAERVAACMLARALQGETLEVEKIQDAVEEELMAAGHAEVARRYILYRESRRQARAEREARETPPAPGAPDAPETVEAHACRLFVKSIYQEAFPEAAVAAHFGAAYQSRFCMALNEADYLRLIDPDLLNYQLDHLAACLRPGRDELFPLSGLQALYDDYLLADESRRIETPQFFWMRVAMGLALREPQREARAMEFYETLSSLRFIPSAAILRSAGSPRPRLISGGAPLPGAGGVEQVASDSQACVWVEPWHPGIFELLRQPAADGEPAVRSGLWLPDLFLKRVREQGRWMIFEPADAADLHRLHGVEFERRYIELEQRAENGQLKSRQVFSAPALWREIAAVVAATGQPWLAFKDSANRRAPAGEGVRHGGFCDGVLAGAAMGAINLPAHLAANGTPAVDLPLLRRTVASAMRMLDNAWDVSGGPVPAARPIALGMHGFQDALDRLRIRHDSDAAAQFADHAAEAIACCAAFCSAEMAVERGAGMDFPDPLWDADCPLPADWPIAREDVPCRRMRHGAVTAIVSDPAAAIAGLHPGGEPSAPMPARRLIECAARRQKWLDMGQSLELNADDADEAAELCLLAWEKGLKTVRINQGRAVAAPIPPPALAPA